MDSYPRCIKECQPVTTLFVDSIHCLNKKSTRTTTRRGQEEEEEEGDEGRRWRRKKDRDRHCLLCHAFCQQLLTGPLNTPSPSASSSHTSPMPSLSASSWPELGVRGQLSLLHRAFEQGSVWSGHESKSLSTAHILPSPAHPTLHLSKLKKQTHRKATVNNGRDKESAVSRPTVGRVN